MKTVFLMTHIPNPRINKRISLIKTLGSCAVICVRRTTIDIWEPEHEDVPHNIIKLNMPDSKHFLKRIKYTLIYLRHSLSILKKYIPSIVYADGFDSLVVASYYAMTHKVKIIYEVADLREALIEKQKNLMSKIKSYLVRSLERFSLKKVACLVITSERFYDIHYNKVFDKDKTIFIPNIPDLNAFIGYTKKNIGDFTVGFIGGIRYMQQMKLLADAAKELNIRVSFSGAGGTDTEFEEIKSYCKDIENIEFTGKYNYSKDIARLYGRVDCIYSVYDADNANVRIALPNKLYESIYCELPIIVAKGTYLAELVEEWGVGVTVSHKNEQELIEVLTKLSNDKEYYNSFIRACRNNKDKINLEVYNQKVKERIECLV